MDERRANDARDTEELNALIDSLLPVLVDRLEETGLGEIEVERNGATVRVRAETVPVVPAGAAQVTKGGGAARQPNESPVLSNEVRDAADARRHSIRSTAVGFVTLAPDIHVGAKVAKGAIVANVDVLGVAAEVRAEFGGIIAVLKCSSGDPVEYGQPLFMIESIGEGAR
jgi:acetyl-CoA carboxylase biotin carboxyl carrier protein